MVKKEIAWAWLVISKSYHTIEKILSSRYGNSCVMHSPRIHTCIRRANIGVARRILDAGYAHRSVLENWNLFILKIWEWQEILRNSWTIKYIYSRISSEVYRHGIARANYSWYFKIWCRFKFIRIHFPYFYFTCNQTDSVNKINQLLRNGLPQWIKIIKMMIAA